jgi:hypothetical protein
MNEHGQFLELGARIGRGQAFGLIAAKSLAAQAQCLLEIRDAGTYKLLDLTWDEFCPQCVGLSRPRVDQLIHNLEEFGANYFQLSEIVKISPETYRRIAPQVQDGVIEIEGETVAITPENAPRIRKEIQKVRNELQEAHNRFEASVRPNICALQIRLDSCFADMRRMIDHLPMYIDSAPALRGLCVYSIDHLTRIQAHLARRME